MSCGCRSDFASVVIAFGFSIPAFGFSIHKDDNAMTEQRAFPKVDPKQKQHTFSALAASPSLTQSLSRGACHQV